MSNGSRWIPAVVSAAIGVALMFLLGYILSKTVDTIGTGVQLGIAAACYFITALIAGAWARRKEVGIYAALLLFIVNVVVSLSGGYQGGSYTIVGIIIGALIAIAIGFIGGLVGQMVRR